MIFHPVEIDLFQVDAPDVAVVHGPVINHPVAGVRCDGELGGTGHIGGSLSPGEFGSRRDVEVVQDMKGLKDAFPCVRLFRCGKLEEGGTDETGWRGEVSG